MRKIEPKYLRIHEIINVCDTLKEQLISLAREESLTVRESEMPDTTASTVQAEVEHHLAQLMGMAAWLKYMRQERQ